jgi:hypothetical protein
MNVTQPQIDAALLQINTTIYQLSLEVDTTLKQGNIEPCGLDRDRYWQLRMCQFILNQGLPAVALEQLTMKDLWLTIQQVNVLANC